MANVIARTGRPAIVMAPNKTLVAQLYAEMREFFPENAVRVPLFDDEVESLALFDPLIGQSMRCHLH